MQKIGTTVTSIRVSVTDNTCKKKGKGSPYSITERRVPELIVVLGSLPAGDVSHKPDGRLPLLSARPVVTLATLKKAAAKFRCLVNRGTMVVNNLPKTVTRQRRDCDLNPGRSAPESSTLTTRLPSHSCVLITNCNYLGQIGISNIIVVSISSFNELLQ